MTTRAIFGWSWQEEQSRFETLAANSDNNRTTRSQLDMGQTAAHSHTMLCLEDMSCGSAQESLPL
eukprot:6196037-Amphidinium_carterae.1